MRPIDADALIERLNKLQYESTDKKASEAGNEVLHSYMTLIINDMPTAYDVEKVIEDVVPDCCSMGFDESQIGIVVADIRNGGKE